MGLRKLIVLIVVLSGCGGGTDPAGMRRLSAVGGDTFSMSMDGTMAPTIRGYLEARGERLTLRRVSQRGEYTVWRSADGQTVTLRQGVVLSTSALTPDLVSVEAAMPSAWRAAQRPAMAERVHRYIGGNERTIIRGYECEFSAPISDTAMLGGARVPTSRTDETCYNPVQGFTNSYWLDGSGQIVQSRQWLGQDIGYLRLNY